MPELRWILIGCGVVLLIGIYLWGTRGSKSSTSDDALLRSRPDPQFSAQEPLAERFEIDNDLSSLDDEPELPAAHGEDFSIATARPVPRDVELASGPYEEVDEPYPAPVRDSRRGSGRIEPTLDQTDPDADADSHRAAHEVKAEFAPDEPTEPQNAPTLGMSNTPPQPKRIERRKIVALRLAAGAQRFAGAQLQQVFDAEALQYGKYDVFHRLGEDGGIVFSAASMVEPGTFDLDKMAVTTYPGMTLFAQLPGPVAGVEALNELVACGKRLQDQLGGTLQDERGVPLTVHRVERLRQEVRDFESGPGRESLHRV